MENEERKMQQVVRFKNRILLSIIDALIGRKPISEILGEFDKMKKELDAITDLNLRLFIKGYIDASKAVILQRFKFKKYSLNPLKLNSNEANELICYFTDLSVKKHFLLSEYDKGFLHLWIDLLEYIYMNDLS